MPRRAKRGKGERPQSLPTGEEVRCRRPRPVSDTGHRETVSAIGPDGKRRTVPQERALVWVSWGGQEDRRNFVRELRRLNLGTLTDPDRPGRLIPVQDYSGAAAPDRPGQTPQSVLGHAHGECACFEVWGALADLRALLRHPTVREYSWVVGSTVPGLSRPNGTHGRPGPGQRLSAKERAELREGPGTWARFERETLHADSPLAPPVLERTQDGGVKVPTFAAGEKIPADQREPRSTRERVDIMEFVATGPEGECRGAEIVTRTVTVARPNSERSLDHPLWAGIDWSFLHFPGE